MAKIAVNSGPIWAREGTPGEGPVARRLATGDGWSVDDVVCRYGPQHQPFEEQHSHFAVAIVLAGTFQYRTANGRRGAGELMMPGSLLLGNAGQYFECGHEHGAGDRCLSFRYAPDYFERIAADAGAGPGERLFRMLRLPPARMLSPLVARVAGGGGRMDRAPLAWEELAIQLAARAIRLANGSRHDPANAPPSALARVTRAVRMIEESGERDLNLRRLAREAGLSAYHFLRTFKQLTGVTPHQYVRRVRLREAARRLASDGAKVLDIALDCGFGDVSNFNRAFRSEFGTSPREFRARSV